MSNKYPMDLTCDGNCSRCGECCTPLLPITLKEYFVIKEYIKEHNIEPFNHIKLDGIHVLCPFYNSDEKKCSIYEVRPEVCRRFICSLDNKTISKNRTYFDNRADINGKHLGRFVPFDLLFYHNPMMAIMIIMKQCEADNQDKMIHALRVFGSDQDFLKKYDIPNTKEIADAIISGDIKLEWSDENDTSNTIR